MEKRQRSAKRTTGWNPLEIRHTQLVADNAVEHNPIAELVRLAAADDWDTSLLGHHGYHCRTRSREHGAVGQHGSCAQQRQRDGGEDRADG